MKLSKREIFMLTFLIIIALVFIEFQLIITPGLASLGEITTKQADMQFQIDTINNNLLVAKAMEKTRDENLTEIDALSAPYFNGISPDSLLVFTHEMMIKHGFSPFSYSPSPISAVFLQPEQVAVTEINYRIKEIAREYQQLQTDPSTGSTEPGTTEPSSTDSAEPTGINDAMELYSLQINATGTYAQIRALLDDFDSLGKTVIISNISMSAQGATGLLDLQFYVDYYGIEKLVPTDDPINNWTRETQPAIENDPFTPGAIVPTETIAPTVP